MLASKAEENCKVTDKLGIELAGLVINLFKLGRLDKSAGDRLSSAED